MSDTHAVTLEPALDAAAAPDLADRLRALRGRALELDASQVKSVGAQSVQVLLSAAVSWKAEGKDFRVISPSADFEEALRLLGLTVDTLTAGGASA